jgi:hypothetical protein
MFLGSANLEESVTCSKFKCLAHEVGGKADCILIGPVPYLPVFKSKPVET